MPCCSGTAISCTALYRQLRRPELDSERLALFPNLDYRDLYDCLYQVPGLVTALLQSYTVHCVQFVPDLQLVTSSQYSAGKALLTLLASLAPFLERNTIEDLPYQLTELVDCLPVSLCHQAVDCLCDHLLPFILGVLLTVLDWTVL